MDPQRFRLVNIRNCLTRVCKGGIWKRSRSVTCRERLSAIWRRYLSCYWIDRSPLWLGWHMCLSTGMPLCTALPSFPVTLSLQIIQLLLSCFSFFTFHSFSILWMFLHHLFTNTFLCPYHFLFFVLSLLSVVFFCNSTSPAFSLYVHDVVDSAWTSIQVSCIASTLIRCGYCLPSEAQFGIASWYAPALVKWDVSPLCALADTGGFCVYTCV